MLSSEFVILNESSSEESLFNQFCQDLLRNFHLLPLAAGRKWIMDPCVDLHEILQTVQKLSGSLSGFG